jgi:hypothetical protein
MERKRRTLGERFDFIIETIKLTSFGISTVLIMLHPVILLCIILNFIEIGNFLQNILLLVLWLSDFAVVALIAFVVEYLRTRRSDES